MSSVLALTASYAFLMSLLKKEHNTLWLRGEAVVMLLSAGISFGLFYQNIFDTQNFFAFLSVLMLVVGLGVSLAIVILHRLSMKNDSAQYPEKHVHTIMILACSVFTALTTHVFLQLASLAWG